MWLILSERYGEKEANARGEWSDGICNDPLRYGSGVFFEFHYLMVSINTLLYNPNLRYSKSLFPCSCGHRQYVESH